MSGEKWKLVKARVTPYFNKVFAARQNLAECCARCFAWCQPSVDTLLPRMMPTVLLRMLPHVVTTLLLTVLPRRCQPYCEAGATVLLTVLLTQKTCF